MLGFLIYEYVNQSTRVRTRRFDFYSNCDIVIVGLAAYIERRDEKIFIYRYKYRLIAGVIIILLLLLLSLFVKPDKNHIPEPPTPVEAEYWITTESLILHNKSCRWYNNSQGKFITTSPADARSCKVCGGADK